VDLVSCGGSLSTGGEGMGGRGGGGVSSARKGRETSKLDLLITGIVFRLSEKAKKDICGDDG